MGARAAMRPQMIGRMAERSPFESLSFKTKQTANRRSVLSGRSRDSASGRARPARSLQPALALFRAIRGAESFGSARCLALPKDQRLRFESLSAKKDEDRFRGLLDLGAEGFEPPTYWV